MWLGTEQDDMVRQEAECDVWKEHRVQAVSNLFVIHIFIMDIAAFFPKPPFCSFQVFPSLQREILVAVIAVRIDIPLPQDFYKHLVRAGRRSVGKRGAHRLCCPAVALAPHLVPCTFDILVDPERYLRVCCAGMVAFGEIVCDEFPVRVNLDPVPGNADSRIHRIVAVESWHRFEKVEQLRRFMIHGVPDEAAPDITAQFLQTQLAARISAGEILSILGVLEYPILAPAPSVIGAGKGIERTGLFDKSHTAVAAAIIKCADAAVLLPDGNHRFLQEIVNKKVSGFGNVGQSSCYVPDFGPEVIPFLLGEFRTIISVTRDRISAQIGRIASINRWWNSVLICHSISPYEFSLF